MTNANDCLAALADPTRRRIFEMVSQRAAAVGELAARLPVSRPAVSQHLHTLRQARLVRMEAQGARRIYSLDLQGVSVMRRYFDGFWAGALSDFKKLAEQPRRKT